MPITLAEAKVGMADKVDQQVIDEFRRASLLLDMLTFDDAVSPGTGGSTLTYGYQRVKTPSTVAVRELNKEYTPNEAKREKATADLKIFGGSYQIDRVIAETSGAVNEVEFQMREKIKAATNYFHMLVINGTSNSSGTGYVVNTFDGLKKILTGSDTEYTVKDVDISTSALLDANYNAYLDALDTFISRLAEKPDILMMNTEMLTKTRSAARRAGYYDRSKDDFGRAVETYNGIKLLDAGEYYNGSTTEHVVPIETDGSTAIYGIKLGLDAFHGVSPKGDKIISQHLPDFSQAGAVKEGDVEMVAATVLKNSRMAGVLKGMKIKATE
jgi:hypothetical protein